MQVHVFACFLLLFNFFFERFVLKHGVPKMYLLVYFQKVIWVGWGATFFFAKFFLKKPNSLEYVQVLVVTWAKLKTVTALLSPPHFIFCWSVFWFSLSRFQFSKSHFSHWIHFSKNVPLSQFFHRVAMSIYIYVCINVIFFKASHWPSGYMIRTRPLIGPQVT